MKTFKATNSQVINGIALGFSLSFFAAAWAGAVYTGEWGQVFYDWYLILVSPCPLVTDYFCLEDFPAPFSMQGPAVWHAFCL